MSLCHTKKVKVRKAVLALIENDKQLDIGLEDPITTYYGSDARDAVYASFRSAERDILRKLGGGGRISRDEVFELAEKYRLVPRYKLYRQLEPTDQDPWEEFYDGSSHEGGMQ